MNVSRNGSYEDMINLPRPESSRPPMPRADRAKIFSPFAALRGYGKAVRDMETIRINKPERFEEQKEALNRKLKFLENGEMVTVCYFCPDPGPDGSGGTAQGNFQTVSGTVRNIDTVFQLLKLNDLVIPFDDIWDITGEDIPEM